MMKAVREEGEFRPITIVIETQEELSVIKAIASLPISISGEVKIRHSYCNLPVESVLNELNSVLNQLK